jgi:hypothetical protein
MDKVDNKFVTLILFFFLAFGFFAVSVVSQRALRIQASKNIVPSGQNSLLLVFPLTLTVGQKATINCVARDAEGGSATDKTCTISTSCGIVTPASSQTNASGIAQFMLSSENPCTAQLTATLDNTVRVSQTASVQFTQ